MRIRSFRATSPRFGARVWVAADAVVVGDVELAADVNVWYGAVLRGDLNPIRIGARTNIQDGVVIHVDAPDEPTIVGEDVTVGHGAILHGCRVERGALIGMHATVLNRAVIGAEAVVAAGAVVPPGLEVPRRTMVAGVPATPRREVTEEEVADIRRGNRNYLELKSRYMAGGDEATVDDPDEWEKVR
jgi:carbonic anhydrase/acetyltransferase-like protein (isoleucine patch superfamily)